MMKNKRRPNLNQSSRSSRSSQSNQSHDGEFLWLISLSDLMMLLFVFFVVLYSFAAKKLSGEDYHRIKRAFSATSVSETTPVDEIQANLLKWVMAQKLLESVDVVRKNDALILEIREKLLFESGQSTLKSEAAELLPLLKEALGKIPAPYRLGIEGHTDDTPMAGIHSNWNLSVERALNVQQALQLPSDLESRVVIMGFGSNRPLAPNRDAKGHAIAENQAKNRRVTIRIF